MISNLPMYVNIVFILTTLLTIFLFYKAANNSKITLVIIFTWILLQAVLSLSGFYTITDTFPPKFALIAPPAVLFIIGLFVSAKGRNYINSLDAKTLTLLHIVRIPVEICLYWLFLYKSVPQLMTFEGRNFDIFAGITAPLVYYFGYAKNYFSKTILLLWNFICLGLLLNIVVNAILSAPSVFQQFAFDQPNTAILYFPFVWLPACVVPLVLTGGKNDFSITDSVSLTISELFVTKQKAAWFQLKAQEQEEGHKIDGILSYSFFKYFVFEIDYKKRVMTITDPKYYYDKNLMNKIQMIDLDNNKVPIVKGILTTKNKKVIKTEFIFDTGHDEYLVIGKEFVSFPKEQKLKANHNSR